VRWDDLRGFGFIQPRTGGGTLFVHISSFPRGGGRPSVGEVLTYAQSSGPDGRPRAVEIARSRRRGTPSGTAIAVSAMVLFAATLAVATFRFATRWGFLAVYLVASLITAAVYSSDKRAAASGSWRVSESTLLVLGLVGGWPGALIAQRALRHKTRKPGFMALFWTTVVVNILCLALVVVYFRA